MQSSESESEARAILVEFSDLSEEQQARWRERLLNRWGGADDTD